MLLDPESATESIQIAIETASISTGLAELEEHLRGKDFLDAERYPQITFVSNKLSFNKDQLKPPRINFASLSITQRNKS